MAKEERYEKQRSSDLFVKLLSEENPYVFDQEECADDDLADSDYKDTPPNKRQKSLTSKRGGMEGQELPQTGRRRRKDSGQQRGRGRSWTQEEETLFREALELYGRNWKRCAEHVGSRDAKAVTSHAQKHFVKLCLQGKPVPEKVAETGKGYTLSGKLLDPDSASAYAYGFRKDLIRTLVPEAYSIVTAGIMVEKLEESEDQVQSQEKKEAELHNQSFEFSTKATDGNVKAEATGKTEVLHNKKGMYSSNNFRSPRTEYALNRPQRAASRNRRIQMGHTSESLQLVECEEFMKSGEFTQPFTIDIAAEVLLLMDLHAHLSEFEIIGLLAGRWDRDQQHLTIMEALPCHRESGSEDRTSVELDPASEVSARHQMVNKGLVGTGWYHSHPVFSATPSMKDIENQRNYQSLFRDEITQKEPFIGLIVSPYDVELASPQSKTCAFYVQQRNHGIKPFRLEFRVVDKIVDVPKELMLKLETVIEMVKHDPCRVDLAAFWREWTSQKDQQRTGKALTKINKLQLSLLSCFSEGSMDKGKQLGSDLIKKITQEWNVPSLLDHIKEEECLSPNEHQ